MRKRVVIWSPWRPFPDPRKRKVLVAPIGPGCYQLRHGDTAVLFGHARNVARRMSSLLPHSAGGGGHRSNTRKRRYVKAHLTEIEYRTCACDDVKQARALESRVRHAEKHLFHT